MLRLPNQLLSSLRAAAAAFPLPTASLLRRLLCTDTSPAQSVPESYLISTCGLTPRQALKASRSLSKLTTPDRADAVRAFLAGDLDLSNPDVASSSARIFCFEVDKTLAPCVSQLRDIGLSTPEIARLVPLAPSVFVNPKHVSRLAFYMYFLGSFDRVHNAIRRDNSLLCRSIEDVVEPNIALLRQCGLSVRDIAQELGVPRGTPMFRHALVTAYSFRPETIAAKLELLRSLGLSSGQVAMAVAKMPSILNLSKDRLRRGMDFLTKEAGMDMEVIARAPAMLKFNIEGRLAPRLKVVNFIKEKGLPCSNWSFYTAACLSEERFLSKFVHLHEKNIPAITAVYAAARRGKALAGTATL
ncbi:hypothetical protein PR202_ga09014 [Eleusine coracana subsp. coracana]|uniref:Uncharacterized protein n=1 Tax=Eleusine coracana subsp. coracana TaxID=191504 RepID=A0AAV5C2W9_ELECO|nr:hypothetical protein PR202_ga09014 [Eleusine coracana subsp. coracana]